MLSAKISAIIILQRLKEKNETIPSRHIKRYPLSTNLVISWIPPRRVPIVPLYKIGHILFVEGQDSGGVVCVSEVMGDHVITRPRST